MKKIIGGIILYNPDIIRLSENISAIIDQIDYLLLIDNNSNNIVDIMNEYKFDPKIKIISNKENFGVAYALNQVIDYSKKNDYHWALTLDQDSVCPKNLINIYRQYTNIVNIGIICPNIIDRNEINRTPVNKKKAAEVKWCITSASLVNINAWHNVGGFDERLFIDLVDYDFCHRLRENGYKIMMTNETSLLHQLGDLRIYNFFGLKIRVANHSPFRKFFIIRNTIYLYKKKEFKKRNLIFRIINNYFKVIFFEKNKCSKIRQMNRAIFVGIKEKI